MPNNSVEDRYNPSSNLDPDYEPVRFDEIDEEDLFWLDNKDGHNNPAYRKMNETQGYNTRTSIVDDFVGTREVFQRI